MQPVKFSKTLAIAGWIIWPIIFLLLFVPYRISTQANLEIWANYAGKLQARVWFEEGRTRLLELSPNPKSGFTGRKDGDFEIWTWTCYTNSSWLVASDADRHFVEAFNQRMRQLLDEKQRGKK
jgi:hypothetical protein